MTKRMQPTNMIGSKELVDFPVLDLQNVPAKVDTGADSSAIWASAIHPTEDGLRFKLFGPGSHFYNNKWIVVTDYRTTQIKNSFGTSELRYKVNLVVVIGERRIKGWFTLSDRHTMKYPVLLGRRLLKNRFIVDVGKVDHNKIGPKKVLLLATSTSRTHDFARDVSAYMKPGAVIQAADYKELQFAFGSGTVKVTLEGKADIADFSLIYFKNHKTAYPLAMAAAQYARFHHAPFIDQELTRHVSYDKLSEMVALVAHGLPVVPGFCADRQGLADICDRAIAAWGLPFVCKEVSSMRGHRNYLVHTKDELKSILDNVKPGEYFIIQKYIENNGYIRLLVLGHEVAFGIQRTSVQHRNPMKQHLNNPIGGTNVTYLAPDDIPAKVRSLAVRSAEVMQRQVAGVDMIQDVVTNEWYILEVNAAPQLVGGVYPQQKRESFAKFIDMEINR